MKKLFISSLFLMLFSFCSCNSKISNYPEIITAGNLNSKNYPELLPNTSLSFKSEFNGIIYVKDDSGYRYLTFGSPENAGIQSQVNLSDRTELCFHYTKASMLGLALFKSPRTEIKNVLMIGLGGGSIPRFLVKCLPEIKIDSVDIDPAVVAIAKNYFFVLEDENNKIFIEDGRKFVENNNKKYDIIFLDAFNAEDNIPYQLTSIEFLNAAKSCLSQNGLIITNFIDNNKRIYESIVKTYESSFKYVMRFCLHSFNRGNIVLIAFDDNTKNLLPGSIKERIEKSPDIFEKKYNYKKYADTLNSDKLSFSNADVIHDN